MSEQTPADLAAEEIRNLPEELTNKIWAVKVAAIITRHLGDGRDKEKPKTFEPTGFRFTDAKRGEMILVDSGDYSGWICYRHPDGFWVTLRKATAADCKSLGIANINTPEESSTIDERNTERNTKGE